MDGIRVFGDDYGIRVSAVSSAVPSQYLPQGPEIKVDQSWKLTRSLRKVFASPSNPVLEISTHILSTNKLRKKFKPNDFDAISSYRRGFDLYTGTNVSSIPKPSIDHIVEIQCVSYCVAKVLRSNQTQLDKCTEIVKPFINTFENCNITSAQINAAKMNVFRTFIRDKLDHGHSILSLMIGTTCEKYMHGIRDSFEHSLKAIVENMRNSEIESANLSLTRTFKDVIEELDIFYSLLKLDDPNYYLK